MYFYYVVFYIFYLHFEALSDLHGRSLYRFFDQEHLWTALHQSCLHIHHSSLFCKHICTTIITSSNESTPAHISVIILHYTSFSYIFGLIIILCYQHHLLKNSCIQRWTTVGPRGACWAFNMFSSLIFAMNYDSRFLSLIIMSMNINMIVVAIKPLNYCAKIIKMNDTR